MNEKSNNSSDIKKMITQNTSGRNVSFIFATLITAFMIIGSFFFIYTIMADVKINQKKSDAMNISQQVDYYLAKNKENLNLASVNVENYIAEGINHGQILAYMKRESKATSAVVDENFSGVYGWIDGEYLDGMNYIPEEGYVPQERPWYKKAMKASGDTVFVTPYIDTQTNRIVLSIAKMLEDGDSVLSMDIYLDYLQVLVDQVAKNNEHLIIIDETGTIVACENYSLAGTGYFEKEKAAGFFTIDSESEGYSLCEVFYKGKRCYCYDETIIGNWHVILMVEKSDLLSNLQNIYFICYLVMTVAFFALTYIFHKLNSQKIEAERFNERLAAVADIFLCMYEIDMVKDTYVEVKSLPYITSIIGLHQGGVSEIITAIIKSLCSQQEAARIEEFANMSTLNDRLAYANFVSCELKGRAYSVRLTFVVKSRDADNNVTSVMLLVEDIDEELAKRKELIKEANSDKLSGLLNRRAYENAVDDLRQLDDLYDISIIGMDLNGLKMTNDTLGHAAGDEIIAGAGKVIKNYWGKKGDCFRIGGDEFIVILNKEIAYPDLMIQEFKERVSEWQGVLVDEMDIAIGYACGNREEIDSIDDLVKIADERMYIDKGHFYGMD